MKLIYQLFSVALLGLISISSHAKTFKYDITNIWSSEGYESRYPTLEFSNVKSAGLTVTKDPLLTDWQLNSLEINFEKAAKLTATGFKKVSHNTYRAVINNVWIYRQIIVDVKETDLNAFSNPAISIEVYISEKSAFIQPEEDIQGQPLFTLSGTLRDISPNKIVDTGYITIDGKRVNFSLRERPGIIQLNNGDSKNGFLVDVLWMGKGQKTIAIPFSPVENFDQFDAVTLVLEEIDGDFGTKQPVLSIKYKDQNNSENTSWQERIKPLLNGAYGTTL